MVYAGTYSWRFLCGHILLLLRLLLHQLNGLFFGFNFLQLQSNRETFKLSTSSLLRLWALGGSRKMRLKLSHKQQQQPLLPIYLMVDVHRGIPRGVRMDGVLINVHLEFVIDHGKGMRV